MECAMPTINTNDDATLKKIFENTKTIAIAGLSPDPSKASNMVAKYLQDQGYKIIPIYPKEEIILGEKVYKSLAEVPFAIDMVDMFRKPDVADELVKVAIERGDVKYFWMQLGLINDAAFVEAREHGIIAVQNKCAKIEHKRLFK